MTTEIETSPVARAMFTATVQCAECPRCNSKPGFFCRTPAGKKYSPPHSERVRRYKTMFSAEEIAKRHAIQSRKLPFL